MKRKFIQSCDRAILNTNAISARVQGGYFSRLIVISAVKEIFCDTNVQE